MPRLALTVALLALSAAAAAQTPDSSRASAPDSARVLRLIPVRPAAEAAPRNIFGGIEQRRPLPRRSLLVGNVAAQTALTVGRGLAEGRSGSDVPALVLGGAAAGAGFYGAKHLVGDRRTVAGFALAYASWSLAENVARGEHVLGHVRVGVGPLDVRVATPFARDGGPNVRLEAEPLSIAAAVVLPLRGFRPRACAAGLCYRGAEPVRIQRGGRTFRRLGRTVGRVVRVWPPFQSRTESHEGVHVVQGMQLAAATPGGTLREMVGSTPDTAVALDVRTDWLTPLLGGLVYALTPYERLWTEREAFTFAGPDASAPVSP